MIDIVNISSKGQIVIPKNLREEAGLARRDKVLVVSDKGRIVLEKISEEQVKSRMLNLLDYFAEKFKEKGVTRKDIKKEVSAARKNV